MNGGRSGEAALKAAFIAVTALRPATLVLRYITPPMPPSAISRVTAATDLSSGELPAKPTTIICPAICSSDWAAAGATASRVIAMNEAARIIHALVNQGVPGLAHDYG